MKISVVIPCYKEGRAVAVTVGRLLQVLRAQPLVTDYEVLLVVERSDSNTLQVAQQLAQAEERVYVMANDRRYGKGYTVKRGILQSTGDLILVNDADLPVDLSRYFGYMLHLMSGEHVGAVYLTAFGDKTDKKKRGFLRAEMTYGLFSLRRWFLQHTISDTQLGCKLYHGDMARYLIRFVDEPGFLYELQMTDMIEWEQYRIEECNVRIPQFSRESSVTAGTIVKNAYAFFAYTFHKRNKLLGTHMDGQPGGAYQGEERLKRWHNR